MIDKIQKLLFTLEFSGIWKAALTWPKFSLASFLIVARLIRAGIKPLTVLDLGANVGQFAVAAAKLFTGVNVVSIEPDPNTSKILKRNVSKLPVQVHEMAVGDLRGSATFFVNADSQVSSLLPLGEVRRSDFPESTVVDQITVPVETLDSFFNGQNLSTPILLKLDVQGFEDRVIRGGEKFLQKVEWIVIEVAFAELYKGEADFISIANLLSSYGFHFVRPLNWHSSPRTGEIIEMDALFQRDLCPVNKKDPVSKNTDNS